MKIDVNYQMKLTDSDHEDLTGSLDHIDAACEEFRSQLQEELLIRAEKRRQWWQRFIHYCHTGK